jgi:RimJ/RimL family protein N-acetyltransferase
MTIAQDYELTIRHAALADAEQLAAWWNDGAAMAHAGFPNGVGTNAARVRSQIEANHDGNRHLILEWDGRPIGEMHYRTEGESTVELGIKICDPSQHERGFGTRYLRMICRYLFREAGYERIILDTNKANTRAQHVYEQKLGFRIRGEREHAIDYELTAADWAEFEKSR